jgi:hypothetical protein
MDGLALVDALAAGVDVNVIARMNYRLPERNIDVLRKKSNYVLFASNNAPSITGSQTLVISPNFSASFTLYPTSGYKELDCSRFPYKSGEALRATPPSNDTQPCTWMCEDCATRTQSECHKQGQNPIRLPYSSH